MDFDKFMHVFSLFSAELTNYDRAHCILSFLIVEKETPEMKSLRRYVEGTDMSLLTVSIV